MNPELNNGPDTSFNGQPSQGEGLDDVRLSEVVTVNLGGALAELGQHLAPQLSAAA